MENQEKECLEELIPVLLRIGGKEFEVKDIETIEPPEEDLVYWLIEYKNGKQILTTESVLVIYEPQLERENVIGINEGKPKLRSIPKEEE